MANQPHIDHLAVAAKDPIGARIAEDASVLPH